MGDEHSERPEDEVATELKEDEAESTGRVEDIGPGEAEEDISGADDTLRENIGQGEDEDDCAVNDEDKIELLEDEYNEDDMLELKQVMKDEDCSVWTSVLAEYDSAQLRKRSKK